MNIQKNDTVILKKKHPCGGDRWQVTRTGADIKICCTTCNRVVMLSRPDFEKRVKRIEHKSE